MFYYWFSFFIFVFLNEKNTVVDSVSWHRKHALLADSRAHFLIKAGAGSEKTMCVM